MAEHLSADGQPVVVDAQFWDNNLRVVRITQVAVRSNPYADTGSIQTWHAAEPGGDTDTMSGGLAFCGRIARYFKGLDAESYPPGTDYADVKGKVR
jgi:hypothetical protein